MSKNFIFLTGVIGLFIFFTNLSNHTIFANIKGSFVSLKDSNNKPSKPLARSSQIKPPDSYLETKGGLNPDEISAHAALVYEKESGKIVFAKNIHEQHPIASLTKVATFMIAIENKPVDTLMTISQHASSQEPDSMGLFPGEKLTLKQLLYGIMLVSGNDSAEAIAENVFGEDSRQMFINKMNEKAYFLGMDDTNFVNPTGFDEDFGNGHSSAFDLMLLTLDALKNPVFREIAGQREHNIPEVYTSDENHKSFNLINTSPTIDYPGYKSGKPGFTPNAGKCQITTAEINGKEYLAIILNSADRKVDTEKLLNWASSL